MIPILYKLKYVKMCYTLPIRHWFSRNAIHTVYYRRSKDSKASLVSKIIPEPINLVLAIYQRSLVHILP